VSVAQFAPDELVGIYEERMKIEQTFKDARSLLIHYREGEGQQEDAQVLSAPNSCRLMRRSTSRL
jgi:hypothetical protein